MREALKKEIRKLVDAEIKKGVLFEKLMGIRKGRLWGGPIMDYRTCTTRKQMVAATKEGYYSKDDFGKIAFNVMISL